MGDYNPHLPKILGDEWVPIRFNPYVFDHTVERGYSFRLNTPRAVSDMRFFLNADAPARLSDQIILGSVYERGREADIGPVRSVIVPVDAGTITGSAAVFLFGAATVQEALASASDGKGIGVGGTTGASSLECSFDTASVNTLLTNKRILDISLVYTAGGNTWETMAAAGEITFIGLSTITSLVQYGPQFFETNAGSSEINDQFRTISLGEMSMFWQAGAPNNSSARYPWRNAEIQRFEAGATDRIRFRLATNIINATGVVSILHYLAMKITYCEENRVLYGGTSYGSEISPALNANWGDEEAYVFGSNSPNILTMRTTALTANGVLIPGDYTVTACVADAGDMRYRLGTLFINDLTRPTMNAIRELYTLDPQPGVEIRRPVNSARTIELASSHILPQLSMNATGAANIDDMHAYGELIPALVFTGNGAEQDIAMSSDNASSPFPWVRFYVRRFGTETQPLTFSRVSDPTQIVTITAAEFDALPEIIDGWKEITLRFANPPTFLTNGTSSPWRWATTGTLANDQWQVLAAQGSIAQDGGTYAGDTIGILDNPVGTAITQADATVFFAQDPLPVTGFAITQLSQPVSGIGLSCSVPTSCIPTGIAYHQLTWSEWTNGYQQTALDTFTRTVTGTGAWGTADTGQIWTGFGVGGSVVATDWSTNGTQAKHSVPAVSAYRASELASVIMRDVDIRVDLTLAITPTVGPVYSDLFVRKESATQLITFRIQVETSNAVTAVITNSYGNTIGTVVVPGLTHVPGTALRIRAQAIDKTLRMKVWTASLTEPAAWALSVINTELSDSGSVGVKSEISATNTNAKPIIFTYDNFAVNKIIGAFGYFEMERFDAIENAWKVIMISTNPGTVSFNDYEARVGIQSQYRIRIRNIYDMYGPWSSTVSNTLSPGVFGTKSDSGVLIFTTNATQDGSKNLAYAMAWDDNPAESFQYLEADQVKFLQMYGRDFQVAFRPLERGGERFDRTLLIQAAAVSPPVLEHAFTSLRDLAWASIPYVCVRTDAGDRWLASVLVPDGVIRRFRRLQLVRITVIESTDTPYPVPIT